MRDTVTPIETDAMTEVTTDVVTVTEQAREDVVTATDVMSPTTPPTTTLRNSIPVACGPKEAARSVATDC